MKKLSLSVGSSSKPIDPMQIFKKLTLRGNVENVWEPQAEALRGWHQSRDAPDVVVEMNTGGGKTLVGLLMAQSLVNEGRRVVYVCPNNQLVEQTRDRAQDIGLSPALRQRGVWSGRDEFDSEETFCLTNYAAIFNGKSVFADGDTKALIFDDAHVAEKTIRDQYTVKIAHDNPAFRKIMERCRKHFVGGGQAHRFEDVLEGRDTHPLFVPMYVVCEHADEFRRTLLDCNVDKETKTLFAWEHIKGNLRQCCFVTDGRELQIAPHVPPVTQLPYFNEDVRRIFLTATLPSKVSFARTFGARSPVVVQPSGKSGDAQRLLIYVPGKDYDAQRTTAKTLAASVKSCVISPSKKKRNEWVPPATAYESDGQKEITRFSKSQGTKMLALAARYDGIDLPGSSCRMLILDGLPTGESLVERFIDESIRVETIRISQTATRIVQAIGRIFRSNTDHGVVLLTGPHLQSWLRNPENRSFLPKLLQQQLLLANELAKRVDAGDIEWSELIEGVLSGHENWDSMYNEYIDEFEATVSESAETWHTELAARERASFELLWEGHHRRAAADFESLAADAGTRDPSLAAWYEHWAGASLLCANDRQAAFPRFLAAANIRSQLGRPLAKRDTMFRASAPSEIGPQAQQLSGWYRQKKTKIWNALDQVDKDLRYGPSTNKAEEAIRLLGTLLGLDAERPDKSQGTGPDVYWRGDASPTAWGFELKTDKDASGEYSKKGDIAQCHDHEEWLRARFDENWELTIVGQLLPVSTLANPSARLRVTEVEVLQALSSRTRSMFDAVEGGDQSNLEALFQTWLEYYGLTWPGCVQSLDNRLAVDLAES